ncbi:MAG: Ig-like domain-containing protein, partial [Acidobacteria bacterium]|nr:Ig-like domain-containing protein [Acidobacteriota bacterium]
SPSEVRVVQSQDQVTVIWQLSEDYGSFSTRFSSVPTLNRFQATLHSSGVIVLSYDQLDARDGIVGVFPGRLPAAATGLGRFTDAQDPALPAHLDVLESSVELNDGINLRFTHRLRGNVPAPVAQLEYRFYIDYDAPYTEGADIPADDRECTMRVSAQGSRWVGRHCAGEASVEVLNDRVSLTVPVAVVTATRLRWSGAAVDFAQSTTCCWFDNVSARVLEIEAPPIVPTDFSAPSSGLRAGPIFEVFHYPVLAPLGDGRSLDVRAEEVSKEFYRSFADRHDFLAIFTTFRFDSQEPGGSYSLDARNGSLRAGLGSTADVNNLTRYGSAVRLNGGLSPTFLGSPGFEETFPFRGRIFPAYANAMYLLLHEFGHTWLAHLAFMRGSERVALNDEFAHWLPGLHAPSAFPISFDSEHSPMGGAVYDESLRVVVSEMRSTAGYSHLDLYAMGLLEPRDVPDTFLVTTAGRVPVSISQVIAAVGQRTPTVSESPRRFSTAFILLTRPGEEPSLEMLDRIDAIRRQFEQVFARATGGLASMSTTDLRFKADGPFLRVLSGNGQTGTAGTPLPFPIVAEVRRPSGEPLRNVEVRWTISGATTLSVQAVTDERGRASATLLLDNVPASVYGSVSVEGSEPVRYWAKAVTGPRPSGFTVGSSTVSMTLNRGGGQSFISTGSGALVVGYATLASGVEPTSGVAIFSSRRGDQVVSEAAVPASPLVRRARLFAERNRTTNTGIAVVSPSGPANVSLTLRDATGEIVATAVRQVSPQGHISSFVDGLFEASSLPQSLEGSITLESSAPISVVALRTIVNEIDEFLITTLPVANLDAPPRSDVQYLAQVVDSGGYVTKALLVNPGALALSGTAEFRLSDGSAMNVSVNGVNAANLRYTIRPNGSVVLTTSGGGSSVQSGYLVIRPDASQNAPVSSGVFTLTQRGVLIAATGVASTVPSRRVRFFVDRTQGHDTGIAVVNPSDRTTSLQLFLTSLAGEPVASRDLALAPRNHTAKFISELDPSLPVGFRGTVDLISPVPVALLALRSTSSTERFLMSTLPVESLDAPRSPQTLYFGQVVDGGEFTTEFIILNLGTGSL